MIYYYLGNMRLQFLFGNPNLCAAFFAVSVLLSIGAYCFLYERHYKKTVVLLFLYILFQFLIIALTYSRGGWLGCLSGLLLASILNRRKINILFLCLFLMCLFTTNQGMQRADPEAVVSDKSIHNRLLVWKGACGLIAKHWRSGVGLPPAVGNCYMKHYQQHESNGGYKTLLSDPLTFAGSFGLPAFFILEFLLLLIWWAGYKVWKDNRGEMLLYALCACSCFLVCGFFSTLFCSLMVLVPVFVSWGIILYCIVKENCFQPRIMEVLAGGCIAAMSCLLIIVTGREVNCNQIPAMKNERGEVVFIPHGSGQSVPILFLTRDPEEDRILMRILAGSGCHVESLTLCMGLSGLSEIRTYLNRRFASLKPVVLLGMDQERSLSALALRTIGENMKVIAVNLPQDWPFRELSPQELIPVNQSEILFIQSRNDAETIIALNTICREGRVPAEFKIFNRISIESITDAIRYAVDRMKQKRLSRDPGKPSVCCMQKLLQAKVTD